MIYERNRWIVKEIGKDIKSFFIKKESEKDFRNNHFQSIREVDEFIYQQEQQLKEKAIESLRALAETLPYMDENETVKLCPKPFHFMLTALFEKLDENS